MSTHTKDVPTMETLELRDKSQKCDYSSEFLNNYERIKGIGFGMYGTVYVATNKLNKKKLAVKLVELRKDEDINITLEKANEEIFLLKRFNHPNIVKAFSSWVENPPEEFNKYPERKSISKGCDGVVFLELEFADLESLSEWFGSSWRQVMDSKNLLYQVTNGLTHLHNNGIIHRDLKPENILLFRCHQSKSVVAKICDFGISTAFRTKMTTGMGSTGYISPEVAKSGGTYSQKADVYALGVMYYEMLFLSDRGNDGKSLLVQIMKIESSQHGFKYDEICKQCMDKMDIELIDSMVENDPEKRATSHEILDKIKNCESFKTPVMIPEYIFKEKSEEFLMRGDQKVKKEFTGIPDQIHNLLFKKSNLENAQAVTLKKLDLYHVQINPKSFTATLKNYKHLEEINMTVDCVSDDIFEMISLPNIKKFFYHQINGLQDELDLQKYLTTDRLNSLFFVGSLSQIFESKISVCIILSRFVIIDISFPKKDTNVILNGTLEILKLSNQRRLDIKSIYLKGLGEGLSIDINDIHENPSLETLYLNSPSGNLVNLENIFHFKNLRELKLFSNKYMSAINLCQYDKWPVVKLCKIPETVKILILKYIILSSDGLKSIKLEKLAIINSKFDDIVSDLQIQEVAIICENISDGFYAPTWKLLLKLTGSPHCKRVVFNNFSWDSENNMQQVLKRWGVPNKTPSFFLNKKEGKWSGGSLNEQAEIVKLLCSLECSEKFYAPVDEDEPSAEKTAPVKWQKYSRDELVKSVTIDESFDFDKLTDKKFVDELTLRNIDIDHMKLLLLLNLCKSLRYLSLENVNIMSFNKEKYIKTVKSLKECYFVFEQKIQNSDSQSNQIKEFCSLEKLKAFIFFNKNSFDNLWSKKINILVAMNEYKLLELNHEQKAIFIQYLLFTEDILPSKKEECRDLKKLALLNGNTKSTLYFYKNLTYLCLLKTEIKIDSISFKNQFPSLKTFFFEPVNWDTEFNISNLPASLKTLGVYQLRLIIESQCKFDTLTIDNCKLKKDFETVVPLLLSVKTLNVFGGHFYRPNRQLLFPFFKQPLIIENIFVSEFNWDFTNIEGGIEFIDTELLSCGLDMATKPTKFQIRCDRNGNKKFVAKYKDSDLESEIMLTGNEEIEQSRLLCY